MVQGRIVEYELLLLVPTLFWAQFINVMASKEPNLKGKPYPVLALLDEFGNMEKIKKLQKAVSFMRSYRIRCIFIVQYLSQIISVYGREDAKAFINSKVRLIHALNDIEDAKFFAGALGQKTIKVKFSSVNSSTGDFGGSRTNNTSYNSRPLRTYFELLKMSRKEEIILLEGNFSITRGISI